MKGLSNDDTDKWPNMKTGLYSKGEEGVLKN